MLISVVIPSYRQPQFLAQAIRSVQRQDLRDVEIIVVDDDSRDESLAVALTSAQADRRTRVLRHDRNRGLGAARNTGLDAASGELLCFLDSDDYFTDRSLSVRLEAYIAARAEDPEVVGAYGDWYHVTERVENPRLRPARTDMVRLDHTNFAGENLFICSAPLVRKDAIEAVGGFPEDLPMLEDFAAWARIVAEGGAFVPVPHIVSTYRQRPGSMLRSRDLVMADYARTVIDHVLERGVEIGDGGTLSAWADGADPRSRGRRSWIRSTQFVSSSFDSGAASTVLTRDGSPTPDDSTPTIDDFMHRRAEDLAGAAARSRAVSLDHSAAANDAAVVIVPTSIEEAVEAVAMVRGLVGNGRPAAIGLLHPGHLRNAWPLTLVDLPYLPVASFDGRARHWLLFRDDVTEATQLVSRVGQAAVTLRSAGLRALDVWRPHAARRYRNARRVLVRSRLEAAELGDRRHAFLGSAVPLGIEAIWGEIPQGEHGIVLVPDVLAEHPALDAWTSVAASVARDFTNDVRILAAPTASQPLRGLRSTPIDADAMLSARFVIAPISHETSLLELAGVPVAVFHPSGANDAVAPIWLEAHRVGRDRTSLGAAVDALHRPTTTADARSEFVRSMARFDRFDGSELEFGAALVELLDRPIDQ
jgi:hypothetical protein